MAGGPGDEGRMPTTQNASCSPRKAALRIGTLARTTKHSPCWKMPTHLQTGLEGAKKKPTEREGDSHCFGEMVTDTVRPLKLGGISLLSVYPSIFCSKSFKS